MTPPFLPPMRILRVPLAAGTVWLVIVWLMWARHLPGRGSAMGLLADLYTAAAFLGVAGVLVFFAVAAYFIGALWMAINAAARNAVWRLGVRVFGERWIMPWFAPSELYSVANALPRWLSDPHHKFGELLPKLGIACPERSQWTEDSQAEVFAAAADDVAWFATAVADDHPALWERYDRVQVERLFADALAFPLACGAVLLGWSIWPTWYGFCGGVLVGMGGWYALKTAATIMEKTAWAVVLEAVYVGKFEAPRLTAFALQQFGPSAAPDETHPTPHCGSTGSNADDELEEAL